MLKNNTYITCTSNTILGTVLPADFEGDNESRHTQGCLYFRKNAHRYNIFRHVHILLLTFGLCRQNGNECHAYKCPIYLFTHKLMSSFRHVYSLLCTIYIDICLICMLYTFQTSLPATHYHPR